MTNTFKIHPAIGIARLGDSTTEFCLAPETQMGLPIKCDSQGRALLDAQGKEQPIDKFKDLQGRIKRQAARFQVYVYQDANDKLGHELEIGDSVQVYKWQTGELYSATLLDIEWTVYLANKKASWYEFKELSGEHGYAPDHPLRNASITDAGRPPALDYRSGSTNRQLQPHSSASRGIRQRQKSGLPAVVSPGVGTE